VSLDSLLVIDYMQHRNCSLMPNLKVNQEKLRDLGFLAVLLKIQVICDVRCRCMFLRHNSPSKRRELHTQQHNVTSQKT
jgi:hypothetical protein